MKIWGVDILYHLHFSNCWFPALYKEQRDYRKEGEEVGH
jgi:hypothetical protein